MLVRLLEGIADICEISYANIRRVTYVPASEHSGRVIFDGNDAWNYDFGGSAEELFLLLANA
jgi:hypothetical protein